MIDGAWQVEISYRVTPKTLLDESLCHVFELFARGEALEVRARDGVPMALSLPKRVAEAHGGEFAVKAVDGASVSGGMHATLTVPLAGPGPEHD